jgi:hypothetical protein
MRYRAIKILILLVIHGDLYWLNPCPNFQIQFLIESNLKSTSVFAVYNA